MALALRMGAALMIAAMLLMVKLASEAGVHQGEIMFWRQFVPAVLLVGWLAANRGLHRLKTQRIGAHVRRSAMGMGGMVLVFAAVALLPLAESTTLSFTAPLFAVMLTPFVLGERVGPWRWSAVALGFIGVLVIAQPGQSTLPLIGAVIGLGAALSNAIVSFLLRGLGRTEEPISTVFWFSALGSLMVLPALPFVITAHTPYEWAVLIGCGLFGTFGQLLNTAALRLGQVASVIVMDYTMLIWAALFGWLVWDHLPSPNTWLGAPLIVTAGLVIAWREHRLSRQTASPLDAD